MHFKTSLSSEEINALAKKLPDQKIRDEMIVGAGPLVIYIVRQILKLWPPYQRMREEFLGAGFLGLTEAIDRLPRIDVKNPSGYIGCAIRNSIQGELNRQLRWKRLTAGGNLESVSVEDVLARDDPRFEEIDLEDTLDVSCETSQKRQIVKLRLEGYTGREIGEQIGLSKQQTNTEIRRFRRTLSNRPELNISENVRKAV